MITTVAANKALSMRADRYIQSLGRPFSNSAVLPIAIGIVNLLVRRLTLVIRIKIRFFNWQHHPADGNKCPPIWGTAMPDISCHLMRHLIIIISTFFPTLSFGQVQNIIGTYSSLIPKVEVKFNSDSTFEY